MTWFNKIYALDSPSNVQCKGNKKKEREREKMNSATIMVKPTASFEGLMLVRNIAGHNPLNGF